MIDVDFAKLIEDKFNLHEITCYSYGIDDNKTCEVNVPLEKRDDFEHFCLSHNADINWFRQGVYCIDCSNAKR